MKRISYLASVLLLLCSCTKYLDIKPFGQTIPKTAEEFSALLQAHLENIDHGEQYIIGNISTVCDLEAYADNLEANLTTYPGGNYIPIYVGTHLSKKQLLYSNLYSAIRDCNIIIGYLEERTGSESRDVLGTAFAIRGICYYNLLRNFCEPCYGNLQGDGVPIVTEFDMEAKPLRSTIAQTAAQADADLRTAIDYDISDKAYRFNSDIMKAYLARLHFWLGDWAKAKSYAREVLDAHPLVDADTFKSMMENEVAATGNIIFKSCIILNSSDRLGYNGSKSSLSSRPVSKTFVNLFAEKEQDVRYGLSFNRKRSFTKNVFACIRSAEMQLIVAECLYHEGEHEAALEALNELRIRRNIPALTMESLPAVSSSDLIVCDATGAALTPLCYAILAERRKELFMEGDRWYELKRNGRPVFWSAKQGRKYTTEKFMYTFPLPISDVELIEGLKQNQGYEKTK